MLKFLVFMVFGWTNVAQADESKPDVVWSISAVQSIRFVDAQVVGPMFEAEERLKVLAAVDDHYRVQLGDQMGWIPIGSVTTDKPESSIDLEALKALKTSPSSVLGR